MNPCQAWQDQLWQALDGELDEEVSAKLVAHVRGCSACRDEMNRAIRLHRAVLMEAVGITGAATAPTIALSAVRSHGSKTGTTPGSAPGAKRTRGPTTARMSRRRASRNRFVMPVAVVVCLVIAALILTGPGTPAVAPVVTAVPVVTATPTLAKVVTVRAPSADTVGRFTLATGVRLDGRSVMSGTALPADVPVVVDGSARLLLNDGTTLQLASGTQLAIHRGGQRRAGGAIGLQVVLATGRVDAEVTPQRAEAPLVVTSPVAEVTVVGTTLQVAHDALGSRIQVAHGQVRVAAAGMSERLLGAGESLTIPLAGLIADPITAPVATALVSFIVTEKMNHDGTVPQWCDQLALDPHHPVVAVPCAGDQPPHYKVVNGHPALCVDGETRSLTFPLARWNSSLGLTVFIVASPGGTGAEGIERLMAVSDATGEHLAVLRSRSQFGLAAAGNSLFEATESGAVVVTCTWSSDGTVSLLCDHRVVASTAALAPATLSDAVLDIARGPQGKRFEGNIFLLEVQQGVPTEAALHQRIDALMQVYGAKP